MKQQHRLFLGWLLGLAQVAAAAPEALPASAPVAIASAAPAASAAASAAPSASATALPASASAAATTNSAASSLRILQARAATPSVAVYLDIRSENGTAVANLQAEHLQADIGPYPARPKSFQSFSSTGEGIATIFLVDVSRSLKPDQLAQIRSALVQWTEKMGDKDRAAIVSFGESVKTVQDFTADKAVLKAKIAELALVDLHTRLNDGLIRALDLGRREDADLPRRRVIVTLTDGMADAAGDSTREDTLARIKEEPVPIYAIGFAAATVAASDKEQGFKQLGAFAHASGGAFMAAGDKPLAQIYTELNGTIHEASLLLLDCATCPGDGRAYPLRVKLQADKRVLTASSEVRLIPGAVPPVSTVSTPAPPGEPQSAPVPAVAPQAAGSLPAWWVGLAAGGAGLVILLGFWLFRRKKPVPLPPAPEPAAAPDSRPARTVRTAVADLPATAMQKTRPGIAIQLTAVSGAQRGREWRTEVGADTVLGRAASCAVVIDDDSEISSRNSVLSAEAGLLFVDDLGSTNGTAINGSPIKGRRRVGDGDLILLGRTELRLTVLKGS
jgi:VWFA-related protein